MTDENLVSERNHPSIFIGGTQRIYRIGNWGISAINGRGAHPFSCGNWAWECAVIHFNSKDNYDFELRYDTPLTDNVEVFSTVDETNKFLEKAFKWMNKVKK